MNNDMHGYVGRIIELIATKRLAENPALALLGPRQCGKSTLARPRGVFEAEPGETGLHRRGAADSRPVSCEADSGCYTVCPVNMVWNR